MLIEGLGLVSFFSSFSMRVMRVRKLRLRSSKLEKFCEIDIDFSYVAIMKFFKIVNKFPLHRLFILDIKVICLYLD